MPSDIKAIIWDMGGVLLQSVDNHPRKTLAQRYAIDLRDLCELVFDSPSARLASVGKITEDEHWENVGSAVGVNPQDLGDFQRQFWSGDRVDQVLYKFIQDLRTRYHTALLSNAWSGTRKALVEYYDCLDVFDQVVISAEVGLAKPDPAIYLEMLRRLNVKPHQAVFVDDLLENIEAANRLGIHGIRFVHTEQAIADVEKRLED